MLTHHNVIANMVYTEADVEALREILFPGKPDRVESQNSPDAANP